MRQRPGRSIVVCTLLLALSARADGQACQIETEPNDSPAAATQVAGAFCVSGALSESDQDIFSWGVSAADARTGWAISLEGLAGQQTRVQIHRIYAPAQAGLPAEVSQEYLSLATRAGESRAGVSEFFVTPGRYLVGLSVSGGNGDYKLLFTPTTALANEVEPNDLVEQAQKVGGEFEVMGDLSSSDDIYAWTLSEAESFSRYSMVLNGPLGEALTLQLDDAAGATILQETQVTSGTIALYDMGLAAGTYHLRVNRVATNSVAAYALRARSEGPRVSSREDEPNDAAALASELLPGKQVAGRLGRPGDVDRFYIDVDQAMSRGRVELALTAKSGPQRRLCLLNGQDLELQCRDGANPKLSDLALKPGRFGVVVSGTADPDSQYSVIYRRGGPLRADTEREPNDFRPLASAVSDSQQISGRFAGTDTDVFKVSLQGEARLWNVEARGNGLRSIAYVNKQGTREASRGGLESVGELTLNGVFLVSGEHYFELAGVDGSYDLKLVEAGVPDPGGEREPNDDPDHAHRIAFGATRTGRLADANDRDVYRFSLLTQEAVRIVFEPPEGFGSDMALSGDFPLQVRPSSETLGQDLEYIGLLAPGDYFVELRSFVGGDTPYKLSLNRMNRFELSGDVEPNDSVYLTRPIPDSLSITGKVGDWQDEDWFELPAIDKQSRIDIGFSGQGYVRVVEGETEVLLQSQGFSGDYSGTLSGQARARIGINGIGKYTLRVGIDESAPLSAPDRELPFLSSSLHFSDSRLAAYWHNAQRVEGRFSVSNNSSSVQSVLLQSSSSFPDWVVRFSQPEIEVPANAERTVNISVTVPRDAPAAERALLNIAAVANNGHLTTQRFAFELAAEAVPVGEHTSYQVPAEMLGGFNVASSALGGRSMLAEGDPLHTEQLQLHDGLTSGIGFAANASFLPVELDVAFGGMDAWPVAGILLNPDTAAHAPPTRLKDFELLLSTDGVQFETVLTAALSQDAVEQAFVLKDVKYARAAKLKMLSNHAGNFGNVSLGEWKVVTPGGEPRGFRLNIADPARGGHVVWSRPTIGNEPGIARDLLEEGGRAGTMELDAGSGAEWVVGFINNRAAQMASLEWVEAENDGTVKRIDSVDVAFSIAGPLGPWVQLGNWKLEDGSGTQHVWKLPSFEWARFLKFSLASIKEADRKRALPKALRVIERPADSEYRSIIGEWGHLSSQSHYESTISLATPIQLAADTNDTREHAEPLMFNTEKAGQVAIGDDEDWYRIDFPEHANTLAITLKGMPSVDVDIELFAADGSNVPLRSLLFGVSEQVLEAELVHAGQYFLRVSQPPHSVVIAYDSSGSLAAYTPIVFDGLASFAQGVLPGKEVVNFMPFERRMLLEEWSDQPYLLQSILAADAREGTSSGAEVTLLAAAQALSERRGVRAIVLLTDASTAGYDEQSHLWAALETVRPRIFTAHIGSWDNPLREKQLMQDWAMAHAGFYSASSSRARMDIAFERAAAWLRRPARYALTVESMNKAAPGPGKIQIVKRVPPRPSDEAVGLAGADPLRLDGSAIELILDASGSMLQRLEGRRRIDVAQSALTNLIVHTLPRGTPLALRVFGDTRPGSCETRLVGPLAPLDPDAISAQINAIQPQNLAKTPIADALRAVASDLSEVTGTRTVVLVTDGEETCDGDPRAEIERLRAEHVDVRVNIVGFAVDDAGLKARFREWARAGNGSFFDASNGAELDRAVIEAVQERFVVLNGKGEAVANGVVGGDAVSVPAGSYRVEVGSRTKKVFEEVRVVHGEISRMEY